MTRRTDQTRAEGLTATSRIVGLGRHHSVELRGVTEQNADGSDRQDILCSCAVGEELKLVGTIDHGGDPGSLQIFRKSGVQLGYVTPHTEVANKLAKGHKFRIKLAKLYPYRAHEGKQGAVLDFEEVNEVPINTQGTGIQTVWIVLIVIATLVLAAFAAKFLGLF